MKNIYGLVSALVCGSALMAQTTTTFNYSGAIQTFTVPACVTSVTIEARGAQGGYNTSSGVMSGMGAIMIGTFTVTPGQTLKVLVGEQPSLTTGTGNGGGGGTFVTDSANNPLIVAGGGGGSAQSTDSPNKHGNITTTGGTGAAGGGAGGTAGSGGSIGGAGFQSGAGGGLLTNGADGWTSGTGGAAFVNGGAGGPTNAPARGGFGGGGSGSSYVVGGGGGGYSGGGSGGNSTAGVGGGGGSYNGGTSQSNTGGANSGHGMVIFTYNGGPSSPPSITGAATICFGATLTLSSNIFAGAISYNWSLPAGATILSGSGTDMITVAHTATGVMTATLTVTDACGTSPAATFTYTVAPQPTAAITTPTTAVCEGANLVLDGSTSVGAVSYAWNTSGTGTTETVTVSATTTYSLVVTSADGCTDTTNVVINANANPVVTLGNDTTVCSALTLDAGNAGSTYLWQDNSTSQTNMAATGGTYSVVVTDANGCTGSDAINVSVGGNFTVAASAAMTFVCTGEPTIALTGSPAGGTWAGNGVFGSTFEPDTAGAGTHNLVYTYTDSLGCSGVDTVAITVDLCLGMADANANVVGIFPNPNNGSFTIAFNSSMENVIVEMVDINGRTVFAQQYDVNAGDQKQIDLGGEANGMYMLRVTSANGVSAQRVIITE